MYGFLKAYVTPIYSLDGLRGNTGGHSHTIIREGGNEEAYSYTYKHKCVYLSKYKSIFRVDWELDSAFNRHEKKIKKANSL
jgi:hypothetical protein